MKKWVTNLKEVRPGVYVGNIDVTTPSNEDFFEDVDRVAQINELIKKKEELVRDSLS